MKKCVSLLLTLCLITSLVVPAFATDNKKISVPQLDAITEETLMDIPFFVVSTDGMELSEAQKAEATATVASYCEGVAVYLNDKSATYDIVQLDESQKKNVLENPIYALAFKQIQDAIAGGTTVKYINFFSKTADVVGTGRAAGDPSDASYWEENCRSLGTYNGYKFLYAETSYGVESSEVVPGNISGSWKWDEIAKKVLKVGCTQLVKKGGYDKYYKAVKAASNALSTLFSLYDSPLSISYSSSSGYLKAKVSGDIYLRIVMIRDDLNRIDGYAYYNWGTTARFAAAMRVSAKYPYKKNASGTYEYKYPSYTHATQYSSTPGYAGNVDLYKSIIELYSNTSGYFTHDESIDVGSAVASILN